MTTHQDEISGLFLTFLSIVACVTAYRLGLGSLSNPGAGTIAFGIAALMGILALSLFTKSIVTRRKKTAPVASAGGRRLLRPFLTLAILTAYGIVFTRIGFIASMFLVMLALTWGVGRQKLLLSLAISLATAAAAYVLFVTILGLPFPEGTVWSFLEG